jgi:hypothetical protein
VQQRGETLWAYIQRWSLIKNSAVEVSDERAIDAFIIGLRRGDLVEEMGRIKPKTVSDLMDVAKGLQMEKTHAITNGHDRQRMIEETDMEVKEEDLAITTTTAPTAK